MDMKVTPTEVKEAAAWQAADAPRPNRWKLGIVIALGLGLATAAWWLWRGPTVTVVRVTRGSAAEIVYATGSVEPETWSRSTPLVRGRIIERCRCEGKTVKAGDILARLDDKEALATLNDLPPWKSSSAGNSTARRNCWPAGSRPRRPISGPRATLRVLRRRSRPRRSDWNISSWWRRWMAPS